jgi:hypothetical protein
MPLFRELDLADSLPNEFRAVGSRIVTKMLVNVVESLLARLSRR